MITIDQALDTVRKMSEVGGLKFVIGGSLAIHMNGDGRLAGAIHDVDIMVRWPSDFGKLGDAFRCVDTSKVADEYGRLHDSGHSRFEVDGVKVCAFTSSKVADLLDGYDITVLSTDLVMSYKMEYIKTYLKKFGPKARNSNIFCKHFADINAWINP